MIDKQEQAKRLAAFRALHFGRRVAPDLLAEMANIGLTATSRDLTVAQVAWVLGISIRRVNQFLLDDRRQLGYRSGNQWRITRARLLEFAPEERKTGRHAKVTR